MGGMRPTLKLVIHVWLVVLLGGFFDTCEAGPWCYDKPSCGPKTWASLGYCNGKKQSPINIITEKAVPDARLGPIHFVGYEDRLKPHLLKNTGHTSEVEMKPGATISGLGLPGTYNLKSFHFHWGTLNHRGSEHAINGLHYAMELHIVHVKSNLTLEEAKKDPEGIAVLAFFIKKSKNASAINAWKTLGDFMEAIPEKGDSVPLNGKFSLGGLLNVADVSTYYRYRGSLTTPGCNEAVIWTVFPEPIEMNQKTMKKFTNSLYVSTKRENRLLQKNYRPLQPLRNRKVFLFKEN
ncbi:carbonic anhydrase 4 [Pogona vitticeps]